jgi:hypothetical protein
MGQLTDTHARTHTSGNIRTYTNTQETDTDTDRRHSSDGFTIDAKEHVQPPDSGMHRRAIVRHLQRSHDASIRLLYLHVQFGFLHPCMTCTASFCTASKRYAVHRRGMLHSIEEVCLHDMHRQFLHSIADVSSFGYLFDQIVSKRYHVSSPTCHHFIIWVPLRSDSSHLIE